MTHPRSRAEADLKMWKEFSRKDKMLYTLENKMLLDSSIGNCWFGYLISKVCSTVFQLKAFMA